MPLLKKIKVCFCFTLAQNKASFIEKHCDPFTLQPLPMLSFHSHNLTSNRQPGKGVGAGREEMRAAVAIKFQKNYKGQKQN